MFEACFGWSQKRIQTVQDTNKFQQLCFLQLSPDSRTDVLLPIHAELYFNLSSTDTARGIVRYTGYNVFFFLTNYKYIVFVALCVLCCKRMESSTASLERKNHKQNYWHLCMQHNFPTCTSCQATFGSGLFCPITAICWFLPAVQQGSWSIEQEGSSG